MTDLVTPEYRALLQAMHAPGAQPWGTGGWEYAYEVLALAKRVRAKSILDYGCGIGTLSKHSVLSRYKIAEYDPGVAGKDELPKPAHVVVCTDVMEHIEPDCLGAVIDHLLQLTVKVCYLGIATRPATRLLPDGRNAHLIVEEPRWWVNRFRKRRGWHVQKYDHRDELLKMVIVKAGGSYRLW